MKYIISDGMIDRLKRLSTRKECSFVDLNLKDYTLNDAYHLGVNDGYYDAEKHLAQDILISIKEDGLMINEMLQDFNKLLGLEIKYLLIAEHGENVYNIYHLCGYEEKPTINDIIHLREELLHDEDFGVDRPDIIDALRITIIPYNLFMPDEVYEYISKVLLDNEEEDIL